MVKPPYHGMSSKPLRPVEWIGSSLKDLRAFPDDVRDAVGFALAQISDKHAAAKPLKGFAGAGVLEVVEDHDGDTFRAVYTVRFASAVYVLHAFQKKSKSGIATPKADIELARQRLKHADDRHKQRKGSK